MKYVLSAHDTHSAVDAEKYDACISFLQSRSPDWLKRELSLTNSLGFYGKIMQILKPEVVILESFQANTEQDNKEISLLAINAPVRQENKSDKEISDDILYLLEQHYGHEKANGFLEVFPPTGVVAHIRKLSQNTNYESVIEQMRSDVDYFSFVFFSKRN